MRNVYKTVVGKREKKRQFGRPRRRWEYNIRTDFGELGWEIVDWVHLNHHSIRGGGFLE
jgi:hypothetical protein